jgi:glycosyltransferase involved in cell wall biosynthesis
VVRRGQTRLSVRVVLVIDDLRIAGAQRVIVQEARALHPHQVAFSAVALAPDPVQSFAPDLRAIGVDIHHVPGRGLCDVARARRLADLIRRLAPDLVHTHLTYANIVGTLAARLAGRPSVASIHNVDTNQLKLARPKRWLEGFVLRHWAARVAVVAEGARVPVGRTFCLPPDHLFTVANGVDPHSVRLPVDYDRTEMRRLLGVSPGESLLCNVGRLERSKGQGYFLEALAELRGRNPGCRFRALLIGGGPGKEDLQRLVTHLRLSDRVQLLGLRADIAEIVAASDLFVLSSLNEGLSQALLEAMALGVPVVATDVGGTSDAVVPDQTGWLVPPADSTSVALAIEHALGDKREATQRAHAAQELVHRDFSLSGHVAHLEKLYRGVECYGVRHHRINR